MSVLNGVIEAVIARDGVAGAGGSATLVAVHSTPEEPAALCLAQVSTHSRDLTDLRRRDLQGRRLQGRASNAAFGKFC